MVYHNHRVDIGGDMNKQDVKDVVKFVKNYPYLIANEVGFKDIKKDPHNEWMKKIINGDDDYTLMAHRGSYKSSCLSVCIALIMVIFRNENIIFLRKADNDVSEMIRMVKKALESDILQKISFLLYGQTITLIESTASTITTNLYKSSSGASQLLGIGIKSSITGKHADVVITDDICNISDRISKAERDRTKLQYQELQNIRNRDGRIINTGTKWHKDDVFTLMDNIEICDCYHTGLITKDKLKKIKESMTPSLFACNYELRIIASEDVIFTNPITGGDPAMCEQGMAHVDAAFGGEDYTAFTIMHKIQGKYYVFGKMWRKHVESCYDDIKKYYTQFMCGKMPIEDNGDKGFTARDLKKQGIRAYTYHESMNKHIKITTYLLRIWQDVIFVEGTDEEYINQICDYNEDAEHDDACLDGNTMIATLTGNKPIKDIKIGEYVITPAGIRKVTFAGITGYKKVDNYYGVNATHDHKFFTYNRGFKTADSLKSADRIDTIGLRRLLSWKKRLLYSMEKPISEAQRADIISSTQPKMQKEKMPNSFIERCGNITTEKFLKVITYIISMAMLTITTLATWSVYQLGNICRCMQKEICKMKIIENATKNNYFKQEKKQKNGINQKRVESGIENIQHNQFSKQANTKRLKFVNSAVRNFLQQKCKDFAVLVANKRQGVEELDLNSLHMKSNAHVAETHLQQSQKNINSVHHYANNDIMPVYNLTVEKAGCYYANGVLVSNCDSAASLARLLINKDDKEYHSILKQGGRHANL